MAASSGENISTRDLSKLPAISFTFVEDFIKGHGTSSGKEQMAKDSVCSKRGTTEILWNCLLA